MHIAANRRFEGPRSASDDDKGVATAVETWQVFTTAATDSAWDIDAAAVVPRKFDPHPEDADLLCRKRTFTQSSEKPTFWIATIEYSTETDDQQQSDDNPLQRPVKRSWTTTDVSKPVFEDTAGVAIMNTAGLPYDPPTEMNASHVVLRYVRNEASFSGTLAASYNNRINSDTFAGYTAGKLRLKITADEDFYRGLSYWIVTYEMEENPDGWQKRLLSQGLMYKLSGGGNTYFLRCTEGDGEYVTEPVPLTSTGEQVDAANLPGSAVFTTHNVYRTAVFGNLNLPQ